MAYCYSTPIGEQSIVMSVSVCLSTIISSELHVGSSPNFWCMLPMAVAQSSSGGVAIRYVLPVLWMTLYLLISQCCSTLPRWGSHMQPWAWHIGIPIAGSRHLGLLLAVWAYWAAVGLLNIYDMLAHNVSAYMETRNVGCEKLLSRWQHWWRSLQSMIDLNL